MLLKSSWRNLYVLLAIVALGLLAGGCNKDDNPAAGGGGTSITINGFAKDWIGGPVAGQVVLVKGKAAVVTGPDGAFSVPGVTAPYQISLIMSTQRLVITYDGLTRADPTLCYLIGSLGVSKSATITGTVPAAAGKVTRVQFVSGMMEWGTYADPGTGSYTIVASWTDSATTCTGTMYVLRWTQGTNWLPTGYDAFVERNHVISAGGSSTVNFITTDFADPAEQTIAGSVVCPTGYTLTDKALFLSFGNAMLPLGSEIPPGSTNNFSYIVPTIAGATNGVVATADASPPWRWVRFYKTGIPGGASGVNMALEAAPQPILPVDNGINVDTSTQFLWTPGGGTGISEVWLVGGTNDPTYCILTAANTISIPNFSPQGQGLPANTRYTWNVHRYYPSSMDGIASGSFPAFTQGHRGDVGFGQSGTFTFTTKP